LPYSESSYWAILKKRCFDYANGGMTCEVFIPSNDIGTEGWECGRPGAYDDGLEMVVCEEHKRALVDRKAARPKSVAASTRRLSGAA
jgi:hypothetical protein